jgi:hypothetical protein
MWQRKQTIYLALVAILMIVASIYAAITILQILGGIIAGLGALNIFQYKNRRKQMAFCTLGVLLLIVWIALFCFDHYHVFDGSSSQLHLQAAVRYPLYALLPVVSIVLFALARKGIKHDDDLVRSADRLR